MNERPIGGEPSATWMRYVTDLESKLQAAEAAIEKKEAEIQQRLHEIGLTYKVQMDLKSEVDRYAAMLAEANTNRMGMIELVDRLQAEVARLTSEVREWLCDSCNTIYPGPPQKGIWCVVCPKCGGDTAPTKTIELRKARTRIAELDEIKNRTNQDEAQRLEMERLDATSTALRWGAENRDLPITGDEWIICGLEALLGEGE